MSPAPPPTDPLVFTGFTHAALPARVVFGTGTLARLPAELATLGVHRALILTTPQQAELGARVAALLGPTAVATFTGAAMHTPVAVTDAALTVLHESRADALVAIGGGSTTGLGKALALRTGLPQLAVPTTYAGSEMTPILGQTEAGRKTTLRSPDVLPEVVLYDVSLTLGLPPALSATSGMNAIAHAVEALYAADRSPVISLMAESAIAALARALPTIVASPTDAAARAEALYGAWLCGTCLGSAGMALHHKLCHVLGGMFDLPHAETHAALLPHAVAYNAAAAPDAMRRIARALGAPDDDASAALLALARRLGCPTALRDLGMPEGGIDRAAQAAASSPYPNPRPIEPAAIRALIARAHAGTPPAP